MRRIESALFWILVGGYAGLGLAAEIMLLWETGLRLGPLAHFSRLFPLASAALPIVAWLWARQRILEVPPESGAEILREAHKTGRRWRWMAVVAMFGLTGIVNGFLISRYGMAHHRQKVALALAWNGAQRGPATLSITPPTEPEALASLSDSGILSVRVRVQTRDTLGYLPFGPLDNGTLSLAGDPSLFADRIVENGRETAPGVKLPLRLVSPFLALLRPASPQPEVRILEGSIPGSVTLEFEGRAEAIPLLARRALTLRFGLQVRGHDALGNELSGGDSYNCPVRLAPSTP